MSYIYVMSVFDDVTGWSFLHLLDQDMVEIKRFQIEDLEEPNGLNFLEMNVHGHDSGVIVCTAQFTHESWSTDVSYIFGIDTAGNVVWSHRGQLAPEGNVHRDVRDTRQVGPVIYTSHRDPPGISAYTIATGEILWESGVEHPIGAGATLTSLHLSDGERLNAPTFGSSNLRIRQLNAETGAVIFDELLGFSANIYYQIEESGRVIIGSRPIRAYNSLDLSIESWSRAGERHHEPIVLDDGSFISRWQDWSSGSAGPMNIARLNALDGTRQWNNEISGMDVNHQFLGYPHPYTDGELFFHIDGLNVVARRISTGAVAWQTAYGSDLRYRHSCDTPDGMLIGYIDAGNRLSLIGWDGQFITDFNNLEMTSDLGSYFGSRGLSTGAESFIAVPLAAGIPSLRLLQRDDDNDHGHPRIALEQVTSEQKSIRRGPGTYF